MNCIAGFFFPSLSTFLECPCRTDWYAWYVAAKALVRSLRSVWFYRNTLSPPQITSRLAILFFLFSPMRSLVPGYHGNHVNPHASDTTIIITIGNSGSIQEHKYCTEWETFWFALPAWNLFTVRAGHAYGKIRLLAKSRKRFNFKVYSGFTTWFWCMVL